MLDPSRVFHSLRTATLKAWCPNTHIPLYAYTLRPSYPYTFILTPCSYLWIYSVILSAGGICFSVLDRKSCSFHQWSRVGAHSDWFPSGAPFHAHHITPLRACATRVIIGHRTGKTQKRWEEWDDSRSPHLKLFVHHNSQMPNKWIWVLENNTLFEKRVKRTIKDRKRKIRRMKERKKERKKKREIRKEKSQKQIRKRQKENK